MNYFEFFLGGRVPSMNNFDIFWGGRVPYPTNYFDICVWYLMRNYFDIMRFTPPVSHMMVTENLQKLHKICFGAFLMNLIHSQSV